MWKKLQKRIAALPAWLTNIYFISGVVFLVWMAAIDDNNIINQYHKHKELSVLLEKKKFYMQQITETQKQVSELNSPAMQEKYAREHYWMKRDNEDVFVIVKK